MRRSLALAFLALLLAPVAARAQGIPPDSLPPGTGFAWEAVGDRGVSAADLHITPDGAIWTAGARLFRLGPSTQTWTQLNTAFRETVLVFPASGTPTDTLFVSDGTGVYRSFDQGQTFTEVLDSAGDALIEGPQGSLLAAEAHAPYIHRSADRGETWAPAPYLPPEQGTSTEALFALPPTPERPLGVALAGAVGVAVSDDGGLRFRPSALWGGSPVVLAFGAVARPDGAGRHVIAGGYRSAQPYGRAWYSNDDGQTWTGEATMADVADGGRSYQSVKAVVGIGEASAYLILGRGAVYRTDDGGQTWALAGRTPMPDPEEEYVGCAVLGPDGRLYVGLYRAGPSTPEGGWVYRTADPVIVVSEGEPVATDGLALAAMPNPAAGAASFVLTLPAASASVRVALYDVLGRAVVVVHEGALGAGMHRLPLGASALAPGVYVARAEAAGGAVTARLVVVR